MQKFHKFCLKIFIVFIIFYLQGCSKGCRSGEDNKLKEVGKLIQKSELKEASKILYEIIKNNPKSDKAYEMRIKLYSQLKRDGDLLDDYDKIAEIRGAEQFPLLKEICLGFIRTSFDNDDVDIKIDTVKAVTDLNESFFIPDLQKLISDEDYDVRDEAASALKKFNVLPSQARLNEMFNSSNEWNRKYAVKVWGEDKNVSSIPEFKKALYDSDITVKIEAIKALGKKGDKSAILELKRLLNADEPEIKLYAAEGLVKLGEVSAYKELFGALDEDDYDIRILAIKILGETGGVDVTKRLRSVLEEDDEIVRKEAIDTIAKLGDKKVIPGLLKFTKDDDYDVRISAFLALYKLGEPSVVERLKNGLNNDDFEIRSSAVSVIGEIGSKAITLDELIKIRQLLQDNDPEVRIAAVHSLGLIGSKEDVKEFRKALKDEDDEVKLEAVIALGKIGDGQVIKELRDILRKKIMSPDFKIQTALALGKIIKAAGIH